MKSYESIQQNYINQETTNKYEAINIQNIKTEMHYMEIYQSIESYLGAYEWEDENTIINPHVKINKTIWILWLQGMSNAPRLIRKCYSSVLKNCPKDFEVVLLDRENLCEYINMPYHIKERYSRKCFTDTHYSDLIRMELLYRYGGCWIDATVFCSCPIPSFFLGGSIFFFKRQLSIIKGSSWWIYARKENSIIREIRRVLYNYWTVNNDLCEYFLLHIIISKIIDTNYAYRVEYNSMPYFSNDNPHYLSGQLNMEFSDELWEIIKQVSYVHKLTYKEKYYRGDLYNFYSALLDDKLI